MAMKIVKVNKCHFETKCVIYHRSCCYVVLSFSFSSACKDACVGRSTPFYNHHHYYRMFPNSQISSCLFHFFINLLNIHVSTADNTLP